MKLQSTKFWSFFSLMIGVLYPFLVYFYYDTLPLGYFVAAGVGLIAIRFYGYRHRINNVFLASFFCFMVLILSALFVKTELGAVQAYPILVSLTVCAYFLYSLYKPPTIIERIARTIDPNLTAEGVLYTRRVTWAWVSFLVFNAGVSFVTALWGSMDQWLLWNGFVSYVFMGILFIGEYCVRKFLKK